MATLTATLRIAQAPGKSSTGYGEITRNRYDVALSIELQESQLFGHGFGQKVEAVPIIRSESQGPEETAYVQTVGSSISQQRSLIVSWTLRVLQ